MAVDENEFFNCHGGYFTIKRLSAEWGVRSGECGVRSRECGVRSRECGVRSREWGVGSGDSVGQKLRSFRGVFDEESRQTGFFRRMGCFGGPQHDKKPRHLGNPYQVF